MPLQQLVNYFNQRFIEEQGLAKPPLRLQEQKVEGHCDGLWFGSILHPVYAYPEVSCIIAHDATLQVVETAEPVRPLSDLLSVVRAGSTHDSIAALSRWGSTAMTNDRAVIDLDRLGRTVHMLNFLVYSHEVKSLFLQVHPRHILAVDKEHGAYFEEIILRCGLSPRRIVITLSITRTWSGQTRLLLNRLRNYRDRGYATALKFEERLDENRCLDFLRLFTPDFVRFDWANPDSGLKAALPARKQQSELVSRIRQQDTLILVEDIRTEQDAEWVERLHPDAVKGDYYASRQTTVADRVAYSA